MGSAGQGFCTGHVVSAARLQILALSLPQQLTLTALSPFPAQQEEDKVMGPNAVMTERPDTDLSVLLPTTYLCNLTACASSMFSTTPTMWQAYKGK